MAERGGDDFFESLYIEREEATPARRREEAAEGHGAPVRPVRRRNRQRKGKKYDERYRQVTAYVRRDVLALARHAMTGKVNERGRDLEFSELVESLLLEYAEGEGWSLEEIGEG